MPELVSIIIIERCPLFGVSVNGGPAVCTSQMIFSDAFLSM